MGEDDVTKTCTKCQRVLLVSCFYPRKNSKSGYVARCKACEGEYRAFNAERARERSRRWREANPDANARTCKRYRDSNIEYWRAKDRERRAAPKAKAADRAYRAENRERYRDHGKNFRDRNPGYKRDYFVGWRANNADVTRGYAANRRALMAGNGGAHTKGDLIAIRAAQGDKCAYCAAPLNGRGSLDHIMPLKLGGGNEPSNLQFTCRSCNSSKGAKHPDEFAKAFAAKKAGG